MRCVRNLVRAAACVCGAAAAIACGGQSVTGPTPVAATIFGLTIGGSTLFEAAGATGQVIATATLGGGATQDVSATAVWQSSVPSIVSITSAGVATAMAPGGSEVKATFGGLTALVRVVVAASEDCIGYDPSLLFLEQGPANSQGPTWQLLEPRSGGFVIHGFFDHTDDAADGLALARRHTRVCFAGRNYGGPDRLAYIVEYWEGASGAQTTIGREDCDTYDRNLLQIRSVNDPGWAIFSGARRVALLSTEADAGRVLSIARRHGARCYIGRGRPRDTPYAHTASYFK